VSMLGHVVMCSSTVGGTLSRSLQNVQTDVLRPMYGHADYTKSVCFFKHDISLFIDSECQTYARCNAWKYAMLNIF